MKTKAKLYHFYKNLFTEVVRILLFILLIGLSLFALVYKIYPNIFVTLFGLFIMFEVYFSQKIAKYNPKISVSENKDNIFDSFTIEALSIINSNNSEHIVKNLLKLPQIEFVIAKCGAKLKEIPIIPIDKPSILFFIISSIFFI